MIKLERNAPCHCGSGKKYKKCCMNSDASVATPIPEMIRSTLAVEISDLILSAIREAGGTLKATAKRNVPRELARECVDLFRSRTPLFDSISLTTQITSEDDVRLLTLLKEALKGCGWIKFHKKKYILTKKTELFNRLFVWNVP